MSENNAETAERSREPWVRVAEELSQRQFGWRELLLVLGVGGALLAVLMVVLLAGFAQHYYLDKNRLQNLMQQAIEQQAGLDVLKHLHRSAPRHNKAIAAIFGRLEGYYHEDVTLSTVLEDLRADSYLQQQGVASYRQQLDKLIVEHVQVNPFDKLGEAQRTHFENLRVKLGERYGDVEFEMNKLADELDEQNRLVTEYLRDSTISFWVSVSGLVFSLFVGCAQILIGRRGQSAQLLAAMVAGGRRGNGG